MILLFQFGGERFGELLELDVDIREDHALVTAKLAIKRSGEGPLVLDGVEIVNGYEELTDPAEQEERLRELAARHAERTGTVLPVDPGFLDALRRGMPACSGAALGADRLLMLILGGADIDDVIYR